MQTQTSYQTLAPSDLAQLKQLLAVYADAFEDQATYTRAVPNDAYFATLLAKPDIITIVAVCDGAVVGGLTGYVLDKFEQDRREIYLYDLAVAASRRRQGIATGLITALKSEAAKRKAYVIFVQADLIDAPAIALYEKLGARENVLHFDIVVMAKKP